MSNESIFGEVIHTYTRAEALDDGVLMDMNLIIPIDESGYRHPIACTARVWSLIQKAVNNPKWMNDEKGVVWDILSMAKMCPTRTWATGRLFKVIIKGAGRRSVWELKMECGPGDHGEPVITIMLPEED